MLFAIFGKALTFCQSSVRGQLFMLLKFSKFQLLNFQTKKQALPYPSHLNCPIYPIICLWFNHIRTCGYRFLENILLTQNNPFQFVLLFRKCKCLIFLRSSGIASCQCCGLFLTNHWSIFTYLFLIKLKFENDWWECHYGKDLWVLNSTFSQLKPKKSLSINQLLHWKNNARKNV